VTDPLIDRDSQASDAESAGDALTVEFAPDGLREAASRVEALLEAGDDGALDELVEGTHPADLAALLGVLPPPAWPPLISRLETAPLSDVMEELPDHLRDDLAEHLRPDQLADVLEEMASDDAADVLADLPESVARGVIRALPRRDRREVETLLAYPEDTAGGLMQTELVAVPASATVDRAVEAVRTSADQAGAFHYVYVVDDDKRLVGVLNLVRLMLSPPDRPISDLIRTDIQMVTPEVDQEDVARMFKRYDLVALPVVDEEGRLLGRILHDDAVEVLEEETPLRWG